MPKMKPHSGASKRIKITGSGKLVRVQAGKSHLMEHKSAKRRGSISGPTAVHKTRVKSIKRSLGIG